MIPVLNQFLFFLTTLFGLNTVFVAEQTHLTLDFESNTGTIEYFDLRTPTQAAEYAEQGLNKIDNSTEFHENFTQLKLDSKNFEKKDGKLNVQLNFSFDDKNDLMKLLRFNMKHNGEKTPSDAVYYHLLLSEELVRSNGNSKKIKESTELKWDRETKLIELEIQQKPNSKGLMGETKSISEYWKG